MTETELQAIEQRAQEIVDNYQGVGGYGEGVWQIECSRLNQAIGNLQLSAEVRALRRDLSRSRACLDRVFSDWVDGKTITDVSWTLAHSFLSETFHAEWVGLSGYARERGTEPESGTSETEGGAEASPQKKSSLD